ncbi:hypothetical protein F5Y10DRAFT_271562 [Nemania abortiva]|nr:hypothetical protein F5Y10DRAFT_271562 [Nemania abortiva]
MPAFVLIARPSSSITAAEAIPHAFIIASARISAKWWMGRNLRPGGAAVFRSQSKMQYLLYTNSSSERPGMTSIGQLPESPVRLFGTS